MALGIAIGYFAPTFLEVINSLSSVTTNIPIAIGLIIIIIIIRSNRASGGSSSIDPVGKSLVLAER